jgi:hypothetical protein
MSAVSRNLTGPHVQAQTAVVTVRAGLGSRPFPVRLSPCLAVADQIVARFQKSGCLHMFVVCRKRRRYNGQCKRSGQFVYRVRACRSQVRFSA